MGKQKIVNTVFYAIKPLIPRWFQLWMRRKLIMSKLPKYKDVWPILGKGRKETRRF